MFICQKCNSVSKPKEGQRKLVVDTRQIKYYETEHGVDDQGNDITIRGKQIGEGWEIEREISVCGACV